MSLEKRLPEISAEFLREDARVAALRRYHILDTAPERAFERLTALASKVFGVPIALITLVDSDRQWFKSCYGVDLRETDRRVSFCSYAIESDAVMVVLDATKDPRFAENPLVTGDLHLRFYAGAPLKTPDGYNLGSLCLIDTEPRASFGDGQQELLAEFAAVVVDELEFRQASRALLVGESKLHTLIKTVSDAIYIKDLAGRYTLINPAGAAALGRSVEQVLGRRDAELLGEDEAAHIAPVDRRLLETRAPVTYERAVETEDGPKTYLTSKYPYYAHDGELAGLIGVSRDVTARRQAERALADSEARYRIVAETASDAIITIDEASRIVYANRAASTIFGYRELKGRNLTLLMPDYLRHLHEAALKRYVETGVRQMHWGAIEIPARHCSGAEIPMEVSFGEHHENGKRLFTGIMRDIAERKGAEKALQEANEKLEARVLERTSELEGAKAQLEEANAQLLHDAFHDKLTGLANRALFLDRLGQAVERRQRRSDGGFAVLYLDADRFKVVNDSLGHATGDRLLIELGDRLRGCVRPGDTVARLGGDEFVILLEDAALVEEATRVAARIQHEVCKPFEVAGRPVYTSLSIGVIMSSTSHEDAEGILRDADLAMYHAKSLGRARYGVFTEAMRERAVNRLALEDDLRGAVQRNELRVHYQPIRSLKNGALTGFEALVRWEHPQLGAVSPASFVPLAEESGLIIELDRWVLRKACRQLGAWQHAYPLAPPLTMNVNLSSRQFLQADLVDVVAGILGECAVHPEHLKLEVTESVLMEHSEAVTVAFKQLKTLGSSSTSTTSAPATRH